jgi:hypothetical protein
MTNHLLMNVGKGVLSGIVGTAAITPLMHNLPAFMKALHMKPTKGAKMMAKKPPTETLAQQVAEDVLDTHLSGEEKKHGR